MTDTTNPGAAPAPAATPAAAPAADNKGFWSNPRNQVLVGVGGLIALLLLRGLIVGVTGAVGGVSLLAALFGAGAIFFAVGLFLKDGGRAKAAMIFGVVLMGISGFIAMSSTGLMSNLLPGVSAGGAHLTLGGLDIPSVLFVLIGIVALIGFVLWALNLVDSVRSIEPTEDGTAPTVSKSVGAFRLISGIALLLLILAVLIYLLSGREITAPVLLDQAGKAIPAESWLDDYAAWWKEYWLMASLALILSFAALAFVVVSLLGGFSYFGDKGALQTARKAFNVWARAGLLMFLMIFFGSVLIYGAGSLMTEEQKNRVNTAIGEGLSESLTYVFSGKWADLGGGERGAAVTRVPVLLAAGAEYILPAAEAEYRYTLTGATIFLVPTGGWCFYHAGNVTFAQEGWVKMTLTPRGAGPTDVSVRLKKAVGGSC